MKTIETLEARNLFSVTVSAATVSSVSVSNNVLYITATAGNDAVTVNQKADASAVVTVNGQATSLKPWAFNTISIDTGKGDDTVLLQNVILPKGGAIVTGDGRDTVAFTGGNINGDFLVDTGNDSDVVAFTGSQIEGGVIKTGDGNDFVYGYGNTFLKYGTVQTGAGNDAVVLAKTTDFGYTTIDLGAGTDIYVGIRNSFPGGVQTIGAELLLNV